MSCSDSKKKTSRLSASPAVDHAVCAFPVLRRSASLRKLVSGLNDRPRQPVSRYRSIENLYEAWFYPTARRRPSADDDFQQLASPATRKLHKPVTRQAARFKLSHPVPENSLHRRVNLIIEAATTSKESTKQVRTELEQLSVKRTVNRYSAGNFDYLPIVN